VQGADRHVVGDRRLVAIDCINRGADFAQWRALDLFGRAIPDDAL
jgi:hypothetical protein